MKLFRGMSGDATIYVSELPQELRSAIAQGTPVVMVDSRTNEQYVVIRAEMFERLKTALDFSEPGENEHKALLQHWGKQAGWEEPDAGVFDDIEPK